MGRRGRSIFGIQGHVFFLTTTIVHYAALFACGEEYYMILLDSLKFLLREHQTKLIAYVLMPSHVHFIVDMPEGQNVSDFMRDFKKFTSTKIRQQLEIDKQDYWLKRLRWNATGVPHQKFKLWMDRFDDEVIESDEILETKMNYIHDNPVKANLVKNPEDWKFSSARNYMLNDHSLIDVQTHWLFE